MTDPHVREVGRVGDLDGRQLEIGVDYGSVYLGVPFGLGKRWRLTQHQAGEFARLFVSAVWQAGQQAGRGGEAAGLDVPGHG